MSLTNDRAVPSTEAVEQLQTDPQLSPNSPSNPGENTIFATSVGPQEPLTVAKIEVEARPGVMSSLIGHSS